MTPTVWVTGAGGFTGRFMIAALKSQQHTVRVVGLDIRVPEHHQADVFLEKDMGDIDAIAAAARAEPPDFVIHLAGLMPPFGEEEMRRVNVDASINLIKALDANNHKVRLVSAGSAGEYLPGNQPLSEDAPVGGTNPYGRTKAEQTKALIEFESDTVEVVVARPFNLVGPGLSPNLVAGGMLEQFFDTGRSEGFVAPRGPIDSVRDFIDVRDVCAAYWLLAERGETGQVYNISSGKGTPVVRIIEIMQDILKIDIDIRPAYDPEVIKPDSFVGDNRKLAALGWRPVISLEQSLRDMVEQRQKI